MTTARLTRITGGQTPPTVHARLTRITGNTTVTPKVTARVTKVTGNSTAKRSLLLGSIPISKVCVGSSAIDRIFLAGTLLYGSTPPILPGGEPWDWSDTNLPWTFTDPTVLRTGWPSSVNVVDLQTGAPDFYTNLQNTVNAANQRTVVRLQPGRYILNSFRLIGSSGSPTYAFGFWFPNLQGFICEQGAGQASIEMAANSTSQAQLTDMQTMSSDSSGRPNLMGLCRLDGTDASPVLLSGVTFRGDDQQVLTAVDPTLTGVYVPQPAPYNGVVFYQGTTHIVNYCRFQAAAHAMTSLPPFEHANTTSQYGTGTYRHTEFDGRLSDVFNPARPRRSGVYMGNNEILAQHFDCWFHHSNVSRYAVNDQNRNTSGLYSLTRCKSEHITELHNVDPAQNGGNSLGGWTNASNYGWESCNGTISLTDCIIQQDNPSTSTGIAHHISLTPVGARGNPQGGRLSVTRGRFINNGFPTADGYLCIRAIASTYWVTDGYATTMNINDGTNRKNPYVVASWPPDPATLAAAGVSPATHYLVRTS